MDDSRNVGVRFIEPAGKLPKRTEMGGKEGNQKFGKGKKDFRPFL
jgi:hypothetical protein